MLNLHSGGDMTGINSLWEDIAKWLSAAMARIP